MMGHLILTKLYFQFMWGFIVVGWAEGKNFAQVHAKTDILKGPQSEFQVIIFKPLDLNS